MGTNPWSSPLPMESAKHRTPHQGRENQCDCRLWEATRFSKTNISKPSSTTCAIWGRLVTFVLLFPSL